MKSVVIVGSGSVAGALAVAIGNSRMRLVQIYARNHEKAERLAEECCCDHASKPSELARADVYIIAVSDKAIVKVASSLDFGSGVVAHTSGSTSIADLPAKIKEKAVFYPLQTFSQGRDVNMRDVPILIEGSSAHAVSAMREVAEAISDDVREVSSAQRARVHLSAVFVCNFANYMYTIGEELIAEAHQPFDLLKPLITETAAKAVAASSPRLVQTGPAVRNDYQTKSLHCEMLGDKPDLKNIYINLSNHIWETSKKI